MKRSIFLLVFLLAAAMPVAAGVSTYNLVTNGNFEDGSSVPDQWTITNPNGDKMKCPIVKTPEAYEGGCYFMFKGGPLATTLKQNVSAGLLSEINNLMEHCVGLNIYPEIAIHAKNAASVQLKIQAKYTRGPATYKANVVETVTAIPNEWYVTGESLIYVPSDSTLTKVTVQLQHKATSGKVHVDAVKLWASAFSSC